jgi:hypothetical protein
MMSAFPTQKSIGANKEGIWIEETPGQSGMTMRDYFAAESITWFLTALENEGMVDEPALLRQFAAESAYRMADAMMKAREA